MREPWNPIIRSVIKAIDEHNMMYFKTGDYWHVQKAKELRQYLIELKDWIAMMEK